MRGKGRWIVLALALAIGSVMLWQRVRGGPEAVQPPLTIVRRDRVERIVPEGTRIRVEVLNATTVRGLARRATFHLRDLGFDVVGSGNSLERMDSSLVIVRTGRLEWGALAAKGLGAARVEVRPDSSRDVDLTILLGTSWRPPPETFHP